jgi:hypothetical protein
VIGEGRQLHVQVKQFTSLGTKQVEQVVDGKKELIEVTRWGFRPKSFDVPPEAYVVMTIGGERLDDAAIQRLFGEQRPVLVIMHGKRIDPHYAAVFKPDQPVVYLRPGPFLMHGPAAEAAASLSRTGSVLVHHQVAQPAPAVKVEGEPVPQVHAVPKDSVPQPFVMPPRQVTGVVANGQLTLVDYTWRSFPLWRTREVTRKIPKPFGGEEEVTETESYAETLWAPTGNSNAVALTKCQVIGHDGQPAKGVNLAARLARSTPILWQPEGTVLDTRFCQFLKTDAVIVKAPAPPAVPFEGSLSCSPRMDFRLAQVNGDQLTFTKLVFEQYIKKVPSTETVNGEQRTVVKDVVETASKPVHMMADLSGFDAIDGRGQPLTNDQVRQRLAKQTPVLVCEFSHIIPKQLALLKPDVIILKVKGHGHGAPGLPVPHDELAPEPPPPPVPENPPPPRT